MPKMKTKTAAKKRFKRTGTGKLVHRHAFRSHNLEHKSRKRKRSFRLDHQVKGADVREVSRLLEPRS